MDYFGSHVTPFASPMIPIDFLTNKVLGVLTNIIVFLTQRILRALASTARTFVEDIVFAHCPLILQTVFAKELIAGLVQVRQPIKYVGAK